jgi:hypothetical protein
LALSWALAIFGAIYAVYTLARCTCIGRGVSRLHPHPYRSIKISHTKKTYPALSSHSFDAHSNKCTLLVRAWRSCLMTESHSGSTASTIQPAIQYQCTGSQSAFFVPPVLSRGRHHGAQRSSSFLRSHFAWVTLVSGACVEDLEVLTAKRGGHVRSCLPGSETGKQEPLTGARTWARRHARHDFCLPVRSETVIL